MDNNQQNTNTQEVELVYPVSREDGTRQRRNDEDIDDYILMLPERVGTQDHNQQNTQQLEEAIPTSMEETSHRCTEENTYEIVPSEDGVGERKETPDLERLPE